MPEGHTLHRLARLHQRRFAGAPVSVSSPQGRFTEGAAAVNGRTFVQAHAWGKHLFHDYGPVGVVHVHLGLYGAFTELPVPMGLPVGQVRMRIEGAEFGTDLRGATACELIDAPQVDAILARLGPDPLRPRSDPASAFERIAKSHRPIGALLMDQKIIAGVGNVYRSEVLFRRRIDPYREGSRLDSEQLTALWSDLVDRMRVGLRVGKIVTVDPEHDCGDPSYAPDRPRTYVYRRAGAPCRVCGTPILTAEMDARNLFWCPSCQIG
ncbi:Fpg/Nei family DNA glycosylase [Mycobacteroides abscessus subsp. abscessus]|uniref:Fpg/Nei family DNA glycosylase n=1 Tax=Mycobacteroides abscessus TaxID=36809 RepID=UPI00092AC5EF|nr:zinc finger domain-containing protein [Mycobacteroides abscessus]SHP79158.1 formamidopyrimidine-DNA glycolase [Mycobacteroides abscessus subsp. abscessus]SHR09051.1 Probable formamidopyrimidine-DNA glycolase [Mycobacteroides abscessus subsp. abscessus]SHT09382.1 formamidopyrimidine-DNA glycolase [Mycobacteroides abscessus subsp. abscessus]SHT44046.1 formamidopyrimidine-DNA glycolase [Mycobacteroides abscessus subsp. abscessus]SKE25208.1 formamidopyrimidine-DNA glycolase [Mycobacteroides abs